MKQQILLKISLFFSLLFLIFAITHPLTAQEEKPITDDEVNKIAKQLFCPTCESTPVDVCPTQACADWRALIRQKLEAGESEEQILQYFSETYGPESLAEPPRSGFGLVAWIAPVCLVLGGLIWFGRYLRQLQTAGASALPQNQELTAEQKEAIRQLEKEL